MPLISEGAPILFGRDFNASQHPLAHDSNEDHRCAKSELVVLPYSSLFNATGPGKRGERRQQKRTWGLNPTRFERMTLRTHRDSAELTKPAGISRATAAPRVPCLRLVVLTHNTSVCVLSTPPRRHTICKLHFASKTTMKYKDK